MIVALAFVPIDNLDDAFDALSNQLANELTPILNWLEDNYIGRPGRNNRRHGKCHPGASRKVPHPHSQWRN